MQRFIFAALIYYSQLVQYVLSLAKAQGLI